MQNVLQTRYFTIGEKEQGKYLVQTRSQTKTSSIILPEVHGIDPNIRPEKQVIRPVISPEAKGKSQVKPRLGQCREGIKRNLLKFPVSQLHVKPEQPKLLPGRRPIIQISERLIQSKTRLKVSTPESSIITESSGNHEVIPVSD